MAILAPVVLVLLPLLILPGVLFFYDVTPKVAVLLFGTAAALLFFDDNSRGLRALLRSWSGRWFAGLLGLQFVSLVLSTVFSTSPALSFGGTNWRRYGFITQASLVVFTLLLAGHFSLRPSGLRVALRATAAAASIASVYGMLQYFGWDPILPASTYRVGEGEFAIIRPPGTLGHAAYFSTYLLCGLFAALALKHEDRWLTRLAAVTIPAAILLSGTRAALVGLAVGLLVLVIVVKPKLRTVTAVGVLTLGAFALFFMTPAGDRLKARVRWSIEDARGGARLLLWRDSLRMGLAHWPAGTGLEAFTGSFPIWQSKELTRQYPDFHHESPHNVFLDALTAQGVPGLLAWLGLCGLPLLSLRKHAELSAGVLAATVSLQFTSLTIPTAMSLLCLSAAALREDGASPPDNGAPRWKLIPLSLSLGFALAGAMAVMSDHSMRKVESLLDAGNANAAAREYRESVRWALPGGNAGIYYSRRMAAIGRFPEAIQTGRYAADTVEDRQNGYYNLAVIQANVGDVTGVETSLRAAIKIAPNWFKPHWTLAQVLALQGRLEEAEREGAAAADLAAHRHPEVGETLSKIRRMRGGAGPGRMGSGSSSASESP